MAARRLSPEVEECWGLTLVSPGGEGAVPAGVHSRLVPALARQGSVGGPPATRRKTQYQAHSVGLPPAQTGMCLLSQPCAWPSRGS